MLMALCFDPAWPLSWKVGEAAFTIKELGLCCNSLRLFLGRRREC